RHYQLLCGVSLGFAADQPVNRFRPDKLPVSELMIPRRER
ncbi:MAG TPA: nitrobenzoate reductase, partial [Alcanivorax sp.]|nr:nitrobenzoate reductase [Alcanivorax sp.]